MKVPRKSYLFHIIIVLFISIQSFADKPPIKFGKVGTDLLEMTEYANDTNASAVILCDYGKTYFEYVDKKGFQMHFDRLIRVKILDKKGYDWADWSIPLWKDGSMVEKVAQLKAITFNLENGKVIKDKLGNDGKFTEKVHDRLELLKFILPNVLVGSVLDIQYSVISPFYYNLQDWYFQYDIPVVWSEYIVEIPEYFSYVKNMKGYLALSINERGTKPGRIEINEMVRSESMGRGSAVRSDMSRYTKEYINETERFVAENVPAFIIEEPLTTKENYISMIEFELASYHPPYGTVTKYSSTWESINKQLMLSDNFGGRLNGGGFLKDGAEAISLSNESAHDKMIAAYSLIHSHMNWNGYSRKYTDQSLRTAYKEKSGSEVEINLMLIVLLRELGIQADPVMLSTRSHGMIRPTFPTLSGFNYVIARAVVDEKEYLLDASYPYLPGGMLPKKALNGRGRLISKNHTDWVDLTPSLSYKVLNMYTLELNENSEFVGEIQTSDKGYAALSARNTLGSYDSEDKYIEDLEDNHEGLVVDSFAFENRNEWYKNMKEKYTIRIKDKAVEAGNLLYFNPMFYEGMEENPFKLEERLYPVEYAYKKDMTYMLNFTIPEGYKLEEKPGNEIVSLPGNAAKFTYQISVMGNRIQLMSKYSINKLIYPSADYVNLKEFFNHIVAKHAEQIVLIKE
ncbi:MAG: hypothetical protein GXO89_04020 [Chlorobi bacterium]|nr:hypothetical protein [Chlorobiota bacterium]